MILFTLYQFQNTQPCGQKPLTFTGIQLIFFFKKKPLTLALVSRCCDSDYFQSDSSNLLLNMIKSINLLGTNLMKPKVKLYTPSTPKNCNSSIEEIIKMQYMHATFLWILSSFEPHHVHIKNTNIYNVLFLH